MIGGNIMNIATNGMSNITSRGYGYTETGVAASRRAAKEDFQKVVDRKRDFEKAASETGVDKNLIAAIASRETRVGKPSLESYYVNGFGYDGAGYGMMQISDEYFKPDKSDGPNSYKNINHGARILKDMVAAIGRKFPGWSQDNQLKGGLAAYNQGPGNVVSVDVDSKTTGKDYSSDVIERAKYFKGKF